MRELSTTELNEVSGGCCLLLGLGLLAGLGTLGNTGCGTTGWGNIGWGNAGCGTTGWGNISWGNTGSGGGCNTAPKHGC